MAVLALSLLGPWVAMAAVVSMQAPSGGGELRIPVMLYGDAEESVSGLQFDLQYDPTQFELVGVTAGEAASGAGKEVILAQTTPGEGRVLITGFNNNSMTDGQVATVTLRPLNGNAPQYDIALGEVLASDPDGNSVPVGYADLYEYPPAPPEESEEEPTPVDNETPAPDVNDEESPVTEPVEDGGDGGDAAEGSVDEDGSNSGNGYYGGGYGNYGSGMGTGDASKEGEAAGSGRSGSRSSRGGMTASGGSTRNPGALFAPDRGSRDASSGRGVQSGNRPGSGNTTAHTGSGGARLAPEGAPGPSPVPAAGADAQPEATEMALLRPASGLIDPPALGGGAAYTLAMEPVEAVESPKGDRVLLTALTVSLTLSLLAIAQLLAGRVSRPRWRKSR